MRIFIKIFLLVVLSLKPSLVNAQTSTQKLAWSLVDSPAKIDLNSIVLFDKEKGIMSGGYLFEINKDNINIFNPQPPSLSIDAAFALNKNAIWAAKSLFSNESNFYFFNGKNWSTLKSPLANQIMCIYFIDKMHGWVGGDRELAYYNGKNWEKIPFPKINGAATKIFGKTKNDFWMQTAFNELFHFSNGRWTLVSQGILQLFMSQNNSIFTLSDKGVYRIDPNGTKLIAPVPKNNKLTSVFIINENNIWASGLGGFVFHYLNGKWEIKKLDTEQNLVSISFLNESYGWVCGENGTIYKYSLQPNEKIVHVKSGFKKSKIIAISTELNSEYGVAIEDLNNDGFKDIFTVCLFSPCRYYENAALVETNIIQPFSFSEKAAEKNITATEILESGKPNSINLGIGSADIDNSGSQDLYVCNLIGKNRLFINNGNGNFKDVTLQRNRGVGAEERSNCVVFSDVDNDGDLDMFVTNENSSNRLYLNDGTGHFFDITKEAGLATIAGGMAATFGDLDGDGKSDLFVTFWNAPNKLYKNISSNGIVKFIDVTKSSGIDPSYNDKSNSVIFGDINNDGLLDIFLTKRKSVNSLYTNLGNLKFKDYYNTMFGQDTSLSYGAVFADFDNDGFLDLYLSNVGESKLYRNLSGKKFVDVTNEFNASLSGYATGSAVGDMDNDGDVDLYAAVYLNGESTYFRNYINNKNYFILNIEGTKSNRDAVGTKIWLYEAGHLYDKNYLRGFREICSGSGYCSHSSKEVHFGADYNKLFDIVVLFPASGIKKILYNQRPGTRISLIEETGLSAFFTHTIKSINRFFKNPETHLAALQYLAFLVICIFSYRFGKKKYYWGKSIIVLVYSIAFLLFTISLIYFSNSSLLLFNFIPIVNLILILLFIHLIYNGIILKNLAKKEREVIRDRIARDLHDDLASTLSSALIYTDVLEHSNKNNEQFALIRKIALLIKDSSEAVTDIIWNIAPVHDNAEHLFFKLRNLAIENCRISQIKLTINEKLESNEAIVPDAQRRNIYLIFKEVLNNMIKHSNASQAELDLIMENGSVFMKLQDNGIGILNLSGSFNDYESIKFAIALEKKSFGHGLKNIFSRAGEINSKLTIITKPHSGSSFSLLSKIT